MLDDGTKVATTMPEVVETMADGMTTAGGRLAVVAEADVEAPAAAACWTGTGGPDVAAPVGSTATPPGATVLPLSWPAGTGDEAVERPSRTRRRDGESSPSRSRPPPGADGSDDDVLTADRSTTDDCHHRIPYPVRRTTVTVFNRPAEGGHTSSVRYGGGEVKRLAFSAVQCLYHIPNHQNLLNTQAGETRLDGQ